MLVSRTQGVPSSATTRNQSAGALGKQRIGGCRSVGKFSISGRRTGRFSTGTGGASPWGVRRRRVRAGSGTVHPISLAAEEPVAKAVIHGGATDALSGQVRTDGPLEVGGRHSGVLAGVDRMAIIGEATERDRVGQVVRGERGGLRSDRRSRGVCLQPRRWRRHHRRMGMPNVVANSQSRSSCAGTAMIAPVP